MVLLFASAIAAFSVAAANTIASNTATTAGTATCSWYFCCHSCSYHCYLCNNCWNCCCYYHCCWCWYYYCCLYCCYGCFCCFCCYYCCNSCCYYHWCCYYNCCLCYCFCCHCHYYFVGTLMPKVYQVGIVSRDPGSNLHFYHQSSHGPLPLPQCYLPHRAVMCIKCRRGEQWKSSREWSYTPWKNRPQSGRLLTTLGAHDSGHLHIMPPASCAIPAVHCMAGCGNGRPVRTWTNQVATALGPHKWRQTTEKASAPWTHPLGRNMN